MKKRQSRIKQSVLTEQYKRLIDLSPVPIAIHAQGKIIYANNEAAKLMGAKEPQELINKPMFQFVHPDYHEIVKNRVKQIKNHGKPHTDLIQEKLVRLDKKVIDVEIISMQVIYEEKPAIQVIVRDITERKRAEEVIQASENRFRALIEKSYDVIALINTLGKISYVSNSIKRVLGYEVQDFVGKIWFSFIHPQDLPTAMNELAKIIIKDGNTSSVQIRLKHKEDKWIWVEATRTNMLSDPNIQAIVINFRDVTERKKLEQQKDEFLAVASHELKTPVTSLKGFTQILKRKFEKNEELESASYLGKMDTQIDKLTLLISDLLDVSKIQGGIIKLQPTVFIYEDLLKEIVEEIQHTTDKQDIKVELKTNTNVSLDKERVGQVITNLLTNALKYSGDAKNILVRTKRDKKFIITSIQDFGIGIPKDKQKHLFERFYRVSGPIHSTVSGLGLGLYICAEIVRKHGGQIWLKSEPAKGSTFYFSLPIS